MAKRIILFILQFAAFLGLMFVGGDMDFINLSYEMRQMRAGNFHPHPLLATLKYPVGSHILIANGILFCAVLFVLILIFEAIRKALKPWALLSFGALILAIALGLALKMGLVPAPTTDNSSLHQITHPLYS